MDAGNQLVALDGSTGATVFRDTAADLRLPCGSGRRPSPSKAASWWPPTASSAPGRRTSRRWARDQRRQPEGRRETSERARRRTDAAGRQQPARGDAQGARRRPLRSPVGELVRALYGRAARHRRPGAGPRVEFHHRHRVAGGEHVVLHVRLSESEVSSLETVLPWNSKLVLKRKLQTSRVTARTST